MGGMRPRDTSPEAWRVFIELHRKMSVQEKFDRTFELCEFGRGICEAGIRGQYPGASDREVFLRLSQRTLGRSYSERYTGT